MNEYQRILQAVKDARSSIDLNNTHYEANLASLNGEITANQEALLLAARSAVRKALACKTFQGVAALEIAFAKIHEDDPLMGCPVNAQFFFAWLLVETRMRLFKINPIRLGPLMIACGSDGDE